jgi:hypothetical protein
LPATLIGARTVFDPDDLDKWAENHKETPRKELVPTPLPPESIPPHGQEEGLWYRNENGRLKRRDEMELKMKRKLGLR